jgi:hypothetical protein
MEITHPGVVHQDQRGTIIDVLADLNFNYATIIMQKKAWSEATIITRKLFNGFTSFADV